MLQQSTVSNRLLKKIAPSDFKALAPWLARVELGRDCILAEEYKPIEFVYFLESGVVSVVSKKGDGRSIEVGVYGREGMGPTSVLLGSNQTPHRHFMQIGGGGYRIPTSNFLRVTDQCRPVRELMLRFIHVFCMQAAQSALVNASSVIEERLARWVLMCHDRIDSDELPITHDFLSMMLGVRRSSVTDAIHSLEGDRLIKATRGNIRILDRAKLERAAGGSYGVPEREYVRLLGPM